MRIAIFLLKRAAQLAVISLLVAFATFLLSSLIPGDFFSTRILDSSVRTETVQQLRHAYGLDAPFYVQYMRWLRNLFRLDLGYSMFYQRPVIQVVADALSKTLWMGMPALVLGFGLGVVVGSAHGIFGQRLPGRVLDFLSSILLSMPSLLLGLIGLLCAANTQWLPLGGMNSPIIPDTGLWHWGIDRIQHLILPVVCLAVPIFAYVERIQYSATQSGHDALPARFARSRGLSRGRVFFQYIVRPGLNPVLSISGPMLGGVLSGSLVLEVIFAWPGLGQITYDALFNSDLFLLAGCVLGSGFLLVVGNLLADIALMGLDPRTRPLSGKEL